MSKNPSSESYWQSFLAALPPAAPRPPTYEAWSFGDSPAMADELGELVRAGVKRATASLVWEYEYEREPFPKEGEWSIILDGQGEPLCIIETSEVEIKPFDQVDAQFAYDEGEGDRSLSHWRRVHWEFFSRVCRGVGREPDETMPVVCERFRVVWM